MRARAHCSSEQRTLIIIYNLHTNPAAVTHIDSYSEDDDGGASMTSQLTVAYGCSAATAAAGDEDEEAVMVS